MILCIQWIKLLKLILPDPLYFLMWLLDYFKFHVWLTLYFLLGNFTLET